MEARGDVLARRGRYRDVCFETKVFVLAYRPHVVDATDDDAVWRVMEFRYHYVGGRMVVLGGRSVEVLK